jgi:hypothetical protein
MILMLLHQAAEDGKLGLTPAELLVLVQEKWWREAKNSDIGSTAWRMWKEGRLTKPDPTSALYSLRGQKVSPPVPSKTEQEVMSG